MATMSPQVDRFQAVFRDAADLVLIPPTTFGCRRGDGGHEDIVDIRDMSHSLDICDMVTKYAN